MVTALPAAASPYENLAFALRQQMIIDDLRAQCGIPARVADEKIKEVFLDSEINQQPLLDAVHALKNNDHARYTQSLSGVRCPEMK